MANRNPRANGIGRKPGVPNKSTTAAREVIAKFLDGNLIHLQSWLDSIASGVWDKNDGKWLVKPDPEKAFNMVVTLMEYHIPKLQRIDLDMAAEVSIKTFNVRRVSAPNIESPDSGCITT